jgi:hypothetical protein
MVSKKERSDNLGQLFKINKNGINTLLGNLVFLLFLSMSVSLSFVIILKWIESETSKEVV